MSPAHVLEPTFQRLKRELMSGALPMGTRLEALRLADEFGVSMTPVRDSLNQLTGEGLVEFSPGDGFRVPRLTEQGLRDMLDLNHLLLVHALKATSAVSPDLREQRRNTDHYADRVAAAFARIAALSGNKSLVRSVTQIGEKLHPARRMEPVVIPSAPETLRLLEDSFYRSRSECIIALSAYHSSFVEAVPRLIASIPGSS